MFELDLAAFDAPVAAVLESAPHCPLGPGSADESRRKELAALTVDTVLLPRAVVERDMAACCISGLWLLHNFLVPVLH